MCLKCVCFFLCFFSHRFWNTDKVSQVLAFDYLHSAQPKHVVGLLTAVEFEYFSVSLGAAL